MSSAKNYSYSHEVCFLAKLRTAERDLKAVLQVAKASKVHPKIRKDVLLNAHELLWDAQHRYLPNDEHLSATEARK